jgi:type II secretory pathway component PulJ
MGITPLVAMTDAWVGAVAALIIGLVALATFFLTRSTSRTANRIAQKQVDLDVLVATTDRLEKNLAQAEKRVKKLTVALDQAIDRERTARMRSRVALANQSILANFIRKRLPGELESLELETLETNGSGSYDDD